MHGGTNGNVPRNRNEASTAPARPKGSIVRIMNPATTRRRRLHARPSVESLESLCLLSQGVLPLHAMPQPHKDPGVSIHDKQVVVRDAGMPPKYVHQLGLRKLDIDYHKALEGTTWKLVRMGRSHRFCLKEIPPPPKPVTPPPPLPKLDTPYIACGAETQTSINISYASMPSGAPGGFRVDYMTRAAFDASGGFFGPNVQSITVADTPAHNGTITIGGLTPNTAYVFRGTSLGDSCHTASDPSNVVQCETLAPPIVPVTPVPVALAAPTVTCANETASSLNVLATAGSDGAPHGMIIQLESVSDYAANGGQFGGGDPSFRSVITTPAAANQTITVPFAGLNPATAYVFRAIALGDDVTNLNSAPSNTGVCETAETTFVSLDAPAVACSNETTTTIDLTLTFGATGAPNGYVVMYNPTSNPLAVTTVEDSAPVAANGQVTITLHGLTPDTAYTISAYAAGGGTADVWYFASLATTIECATIPTPELQAGMPTLDCENETSSSTLILLTPGVNGAPGGYVLKYTTLADFTANGLANATTLTDTTPLAEGQTIGVLITGLDAETTYVYVATAIGDATVADSDPSLPLECTTLPEFSGQQLDPPAIFCGAETTTSIAVGVAAGPSGAPAGVLLMVVSDAQFQVDGFASATQLTNSTPLAPGQVATFDVTGLAAGTTYHFQAQALDTEPLNNSDFVATTCDTLPSTLPQADTPAIDCTNEQSNSIDLVVQAGQSGTPAGFVINYVSMSDFVATGWANSTTEIFASVPDQLPPGGSEVVTISGLSADTQYLFRIQAMGNADILPSQLSEPITCQTTPAEDTTCTLSHGFWANHPEAVDYLINTFNGGSLTVGGTAYSAAEIDAMLQANKPQPADGTVPLVHQVIAVELSQLYTEDVTGGTFVAPPELQPANDLLATISPLQVQDVIKNGHVVGQTIVGTDPLDPATSGPLTAALGQFIADHECSPEEAATFEASLA